jgi:ankyrin repeat protein
MKVMYQEMLNAISEQDINKVDSLLSQGFDPNYESENSSDLVADFNKPYYVLSHAASFGNDQIVKKLLDSGAIWGKLQHEAKSDSLIDASCSGQPFTVDALINAGGADPNYSNEFGEKSLAMALSSTCRSINNNGQPYQPGESDHDSVVEILKQSGAQ